MGGPIGCSGLTALGRAQAEALRDRLLVTAELAAATALWTSVLARAIETAQIVAPAVGEGRLKVARDCDLCELHPGEADGLAWTDFTARYGEPDWDLDARPPLPPAARAGAASWRASASRSTGSRRRFGGWAVVVCHGGVIEASMLAFLPVAGRLGGGCSADATPRSPSGSTIRGHGGSCATTTPPTSTPPASPSNAADEAPVAEQV